MYSNGITHYIFFIYNIFICVWFFGGCLGVAIKTVLIINKIMIKDNQPEQITVSLSASGFVTGVNCLYFTPTRNKN